MYVLDMSVVYVAEAEGGSQMIHHKGTQTLETDRLILRQYKMEDAEDMYKNWVTDHMVTRFWGWEPHKNIAETRELLRGWINDYQREDNYHWVIEGKEQSEAIGYIYLNELDETEGGASVHYLLSRKLWNQGMTTEACNRVVVFAFAEIGLKKVKSRHHEKNPASGRVMEKCGLHFVYEEFKEFEDCPQMNGVYLFYETNENRI